MWWSPNAAFLFSVHTEKLYHSTGRELRRALFSLKQIFQVIIFYSDFTNMFHKTVAPKIQLIHFCCCHHEGSLVMRSVLVHECRARTIKHWLIIVFLSCAAESLPSWQLYSGLVILHTLGWAGLAGTCLWRGGLAYRQQTQIQRQNSIEYLTLRCGFVGFNLWKITIIMVWCLNALAMAFIENVKTNIFATLFSLISFCEIKSPLSLISVLFIYIAEV